MNRYQKRTVLYNDNAMYTNMLKERFVTFIRQYNTPIFRSPTAKEMKSIEVVKHIWAVGDRYYKLASKYYSSPELWWILAWYNQKPTEAHVNVGDVISIPMPLEEVATILGV